jgi:hypothetical protein
MQGSLEVLVKTMFLAIRCLFYLGDGYKYTCYVAEQSRNRSSRSIGDVLAGVDPTVRLRSMVY